MKVVYGVSGDELSVQASRAKSVFMWGLRRSLELRNAGSSWDTGGVSVGVDGPVRSAGFMTPTRPNPGYYRY